MRHIIIDALVTFMDQCIQRFILWNHVNQFDSTCSKCDAISVCLRHDWFQSRKQRSPCLSCSATCPYRNFSNRSSRTLPSRCRRNHIDTEFLTSIEKQLGGVKGCNGDRPSLCVLREGDDEVALGSTHESHVAMEDDKARFDVDVITAHWLLMNRFHCHSQILLLDELNGKSVFKIENRMLLDGAWPNFRSSILQPFPLLRLTHLSVVKLLYAKH